MAAARDLRGAPRHAAYATPRPGPRSLHVAAHELGAAAYAIKAVRAAAPDGKGESAATLEVPMATTSSRRRSASSYSTTSGCATTSVGRCSTVNCRIASREG